MAQAVSIFFAYPRLLFAQKLGVFKPLEASLLEALIGRLEPSCAEIARGQLSQINWVQRVTARRTECNFFRVAPFKVVHDRFKKFPFTEAELKLATVRFELVSGLRQVAKVYVVHGNLFSVEFGSDMRRHLRERISSVVAFTQHAACEV